MPVPDEQQLLCVNCGYDLRGSAPTSPCPECGTPRSLPLDASLVACCNPAWLGKVRLGLAAQIANVALTAAVVLVGHTDPRWSQIEALTLFVQYVMIATGLAGAFLITWPEPHAGTGLALRITRVGATGGTIAAAVSTAIASLCVQPGFMHLACLMVSLDYLFATIQHASILLHLRWIAGRAPSPSLVRSVTKLMWAYPAGWMLMCVAAALLAGEAIWPTPRWKGAIINAEAFSVMGQIGLVFVGVWYVVVLAQCRAALRPAKPTDEPAA